MRSSEKIKSSHLVQNLEFLNKVENAVLKLDRIVIDDLMQISSDYYPENANSEKDSADKSSKIERNNSWYQLLDKVQFALRSGVSSMVDEGLLVMPVSMIEEYDRTGQASGMKQKSLSQNQEKIAFIQWK